MKKGSTKGYLILGILFVLISVIAFAIPTPKTIVFWISYGFTAVAFALQILIWEKAFFAKDTLKSKFFGIPVIHIGIVYLVLQSVAFVVFTVSPTLPLWSAIFTDVLILALCAVCMISADVGQNEIDRVEEKVQKKGFYLRNLQTDIELLADAETDTQAKASLEKLAEAVHCSDPMSCDELTDIETKISVKAEELKTASDKIKMIEEITLLLTERNKKCRLLK